MTQDRPFAEIPKTVVLERGCPIEGRLRVPGSKSQTNRAFVLAAIASGTSQVRGALVADDAQCMVECLRTLGVRITPQDTEGLNWEIEGVRGSFPITGPVTLDAGLAGTVMRFLTAVATLAPHEVTITGRAPLLARPLGELHRTLRDVGAHVDALGAHSDYPPVVVRPQRPHGGEASVDARKSSQFASALLLAAPFFKNGLDLHVTGLGASGYFEMTVDMIRRRGVPIEVNDGNVHISQSADLLAVDEQIAGDASAASHILTLAAATGGNVTIVNLADADMEPDLGVLKTLMEFGCTVEHGHDGRVSLTSPDQLAPVDVDLSKTPDQLPNIAVLSALATGRSVIRGVGITRFHETDRIAAIERELAKVGVRATSHGDDIVIEGGTAHGDAILRTYGDHRLGMAFASIGLALGNVVLEDADCVDKTYGNFWADVEKLGGEVSSR